MPEIAEKQDLTADQRRRANGFGGRTSGSFHKSGRTYQGKRTLDGTLFRDLARAKVRKAIPLWVAIMEDKDEPAMARLRASELLAQYAVGKALQQIEMTVARSYDALSLSDLEAIAAGRIPRLVQQESAGRTFEGEHETVLTESVADSVSANAVAALTIERASGPVCPTEHPIDE